MTPDADSLLWPGDSALVWRWRDDRFEFRTATGADLPPDVKKQWRDGAERANSTFDVVREDEHELYRVTGSLARELQRVAEDHSPGYETSDDDAGLPSMASYLSLSSDQPAPDWRAVTNKVPEWEGSPGFAQVWKSLTWCVTEYHDLKSDDQGMTGLLAACGDSTQGLYRSHPIVVPPEQVLALPRMGLPEAGEYLNSVRLPFDPLFIDTCATPNAQDMTWLPDNADDDTSHTGLAGGLIMSTANPDSPREVIPFGAAVKPGSKNEDPNFYRYGPNETPWHTRHERERENEPERAGGWLISDPGGNGLPSHAATASIVTAAEPYEGIFLRPHHAGPPEPFDRLYTTKPRANQHEIVGVPATEVTPRADPRLIAVLAVPRLYSYLDMDPAVAADRLRGWAALAFLQFQALMGTLQLLESHNVEIVAQPVSRQVRRHAERKGIPISKTIYIRHRRGPRSEQNWDGPRREFSHSFEVMGHFAHHCDPGDKHVWCKPCRGTGRIDGPLLPNGSQDEQPCEKCDGLGLDKTKLTPCARRDQDGNLTCPHGCRKEWVRTHVRGDGPLVLKSRKETG